MQACFESFFVRIFSLFAFGSTGVLPGLPAGSDSAGRSKAGTAGHCPAPWVLPRRAL